MKRYFSAILAIVLLSIIGISTISHARAPQEEIVGGNTEAGFNGAGWLRIRYDGGTSTCSGVLVGPDVVLTAAHCVGAIEGVGEPLRICYGNDPSIPSIDWASATPCDDVGSIEAAAWVANQNYAGNGSGASFDLALIHLLYSPNAMPIPVLNIPLQPANSGLEGIVIGYGVSRFLASESSGIKRSAPVILDTITPTTISWNLMRDENNEVISGSACSADSGGPVLALDASGNSVVIGTVSGPGNSYRSLICRDISMATNTGYSADWLKQQATAWGTEIFFDTLPN